MSTFEQRANSPYLVARHKVNPSSWWCTTCDKPAREVSSPEYECHSCSDWSGCGGGCSVYKVECTTCGTSQQVK